MYFVRGVSKWQCVGEEDLPPHLSPLFRIVFYLLSQQQNWRTCGAITFSSWCGGGGDDGNCACAWLFSFFEPSIYRFNAIVESSALSREQKNKFPSSSSSFPTAPALMCTLYVLCSPFSLFCWFSSPREIGKGELGKKEKERRRDHTRRVSRSRILPPLLTARLSLSLLLYIYINISRPYPRAWRFFLIFRSISCGSMLKLVSLFLLFLWIDASFSPLSESAGNNIGAAVLHQLSLIFRRWFFLRVVN